MLLVSLDTVHFWLPFPYSLTFVYWSHVYVQIIILLLAWEWTLLTTMKYFEIPEQNENLSRQTFIIALRVYAKMFEIHEIGEILYKI
jgi:hypothetical protein